MPTGTSPDERRTHPRNFALRAIGWSLGLFGLVRLAAVERLAVLPFTHVQARAAERMFGLPVQPIDVTLACSGTDALALCVGFILAFPVSWPRRIAAALGGIALIVAVNIVRIGTLGRAAGSPAWFDALHLFVWPAVLMITIAAYVFTWMHMTSRPRATAAPDQSRAAPIGVTARFVWLSLALLAIFAVAGPLYLTSHLVLGVAGFIAQASAWLLSGLGMGATATGNVLMTARGGFMVTQECVSTPLIPLYVAAVATAIPSWRWRLLAIVGAIPLFTLLGIARLLVVALPAALVASPLVLIHAFYQLVLAAVLISLAAIWRHGRGGAWRPSLLGIGIGAAVMLIVTTPYARVLAWGFADQLPLHDPQGAVALLPAFEAGLYAGLCSVVFGISAWRLIASGIVVLLGLQLATFAALHLLPLAPHVRDVRGLAIATPILLIMALVSYARPRR